MSIGKEAMVRPHTPFEMGNEPYVDQIAKGFLKYCFENFDLIDRTPSCPDDPFGLNELFEMFLREDFGGNDDPAVREHSKVVPSGVLFSRFLENVSIANINAAVGQISEGYPERKLSIIKSKINQTAMSNKVLDLARGENP